MLARDDDDGVDAAAADEADERRGPSSDCAVAHLAGSPGLISASRVQLMLSLDGRERLAGDPESFLAAERASASRGVLRSLSVTRPVSSVFQVLPVACWCRARSDAGSRCSRA